MTISYLIYFPFYFLSKFFLSFFSDQTFVRHSFYFKKVSFPKSDLDFTLFSKKDLSIEQANRLNFFIQFFKKIMLPLGEINVYEESAVTELISMANPIELSRDPLFKNLNVLNCQKNQAQKVVFLMHMIDSDKKIYKHTIAKKFKKLSYCMDLINPKVKIKKSDVESLNDFSSYLKHNIFEAESEADRIIEYINLFLNQKVLSVLDFSLVSGGLSEKLIESIKIEAIKWEIWGVYSQLVFSKNKRNDLVHIISLHEKMNNISLHFESEFQYIISRIKKYI